MGEETAMNIWAEKPVFQEFKRADGMFAKSTFDPWNIPEDETLLGCIDSEEDVKKDVIRAQVYGPRPQPIIGLFIKKEAQR